MSTGLTAWSVAGVVQLETDDGQKLFVENDRAWVLPPGRFRYTRSPCNVFVPDLVIRFSAPPEVQPYSDEKEFESTAISWTAPMGTVVTAVWRPQASSLLAPSSVNVVARREPTPVTKYVALTKRSPVPFPCR